MNRASDSGNSISSSVEVPPNRRAFTTVDQRIQDALPPEDFKRIADVRRAMWRGGFIGLGGGLSLGVSLFILRRKFPSVEKLTFAKHGLLYALLGGTLGSFFGTTSLGAPAMARVQDGA